MNVVDIIFVSFLFILLCACWPIKRYIMYKLGYWPKPKWLTREDKEQA